MQAAEPAAAAVPAWEGSNSAAAVVVSESAAAAAPAHSEDADEVVSDLAMRFHRYGLLQPAPDRPRRSDDGTRSKFALSYEQVEAAHTAALEWYEGVIRTVNALQLQQELAVGFTEFKLRASGRYDMRVPALDAMPCFDAEAPWLPLVRRILGPDAVRIHLGCMLSLPGSVAQNWHMDGDHLSETVMHGPHCLNVFVPLVVRAHARTPCLPSSLCTLPFLNPHWNRLLEWRQDMDERLGPTEMLPASHLDWAGIAPSVKPCPQAGECLLFDYRLRHRGAPLWPDMHCSTRCSLCCFSVSLGCADSDPSDDMPTALTVDLVGAAQGFRTSRPSRAR